MAAEDSNDLNRLKVAQKWQIRFCRAKFAASGQKVAQFWRSGVMTAACRAQGIYAPSHNKRGDTNLHAAASGSLSLAGWLAAATLGVHAEAEWMDLGKVLMTAECCRARLRGLDTADVAITAPSQPPPDAPKQTAGFLRSALLLIFILPDQFYVLDLIS